MGGKHGLGGRELKADCIFVSFLVRSLWDVKVYLVSVEVLGNLRVFISWFVSVRECVCVAQLYDVGVYFFFFFYLFVHFLGVCL